MFPEEIDLSDKVVTIDKHYVFSKVRTTFKRYPSASKASDTIEFTNRIICPKCEKSMFTATANVIPHEDVMDVDWFETLNRQSLLSNAPFKCECGAKIKLEFDILDNEIFAYVDKENDLMAFLEEMARDE